MYNSRCCEQTCLRKTLNQSSELRSHAEITCPHATAYEPPDLFMDLHRSPDYFDGDDNTRSAWNTRYMFEPVSRILKYTMCTIRIWRVTCCSPSFGRGSFPLVSILGHHARSQGNLERVMYLTEPSPNASGRQVKVWISTALGNPFAWDAIAMGYHFSCATLACGPASIRQ